MTVEAAVNALANEGSIVCTYNQNGQSLYKGFEVAIPRIIQVATDRGLVIDQRTQIDDGTVTYKIYLRK